MVGVTAAIQPTIVKHNHHNLVLCGEVEIDDPLMGVVVGSHRFQPICIVHSLVPDLISANIVTVGLSLGQAL